MQEKSSAKTVAIVLVSVLLLVGLIVLAYLYFSDQTAPNEIVLPNTQVVGPEQVKPGDELSENFAVLDSGNVVQVIKTLEKSNTYREVLNLTEYWQDGSATRIAEVYHRNDVTFIKIQAAKKIQNYLTDGKILYTWYPGDEEAVQIPLSDALTLEDLVGIPDYLQILQRTQVEQAVFLPADVQNTDRIYASCMDERDVAYHFWIDIETSLCGRIEIYKNNIKPILDLYKDKVGKVDISGPPEDALAFVSKILERGE